MMEPNTKGGAVLEGEKGAQRARCLENCRGLSAEEREAFSAAICRYLEGLPDLQRARRVLSYRAMETEADLTAFHAWAAGRGKELAFPVSFSGGQMEAYLPQGPESWARGRYGIWAPVPARSTPVPPETLDAVILPCVGFDGQGRRLGHGGGYYDRYLPRCPQVLRVLAAFEVQRLERLSADAHDQRVHVTVTESGVFRHGRA